MIITGQMKFKDLIRGLKGAPPKDPDMESTWDHRAWLAIGCFSVLASLVKATLFATPSSSSSTWLKLALACLAGYLVADFATGIYHWAIDNYGTASTPIFGGQIESFRIHHKYPWRVAKRQFACSVHPLPIAVTLIVLPFNIACNDQSVLLFVAVFGGFSMFSMRFHSWAHSRKHNLPPLVGKLQDLGVLLSQSQHAAHHQPPYNGKYCIVSGVCNTFLDELKVFEILENTLFNLFGVRPRSWSEPSSEWSEDAAPAPRNM